MPERKYMVLAILSSLAIVGVFGFLSIEQKNRVIYLNVATGNKTGESYIFAEAIRQVIAKHHPQIRLNIIETKGSEENMQLLERGKVQLAIVQSDTPAPPTARAIALLYPEMFHLVVSEKSGIQSVPDLKGKRIALMSKGSGSYYTFWLLAQHYNLNPKEFKYVSLTADQALLAFRKGQVDAVFRTVPVGNRWTKQLVKTTQARMVPIDQAAAMKIDLPYLEENIIPKGIYKASPPIPKQNFPTAGLQAALVTDKNISAKAIREITTILYEYRHDLVKLEPKAATISPPGIGQNIGLPLHPGAKAYYDREKPDFLTANSSNLTFLLTLFTALASAVLSWRSTMLAKQKNRFDKYNLQILDLLEQARHTKSLEELENQRQYLFKIFRQVVEDLDNDRITQESFQSFTFAWEAAINTIRHQEAIVLNGRVGVEEGRRFRSDED